MNFDDRMFLITAKFKLRGSDLDGIDIEHVKSNTQDAIQNAVGEIEFSSEYYDGNGEDEEVWAAFLNGDVVLDVKEMKIDICARPDCEHCGLGHKDFGIQIFDGATHWCLDCTLAGEPDAFSEKEIEEMEKEVKKMKKEYYTKKLEELEPTKRKKKK